MRYRTDHVCACLAQTQALESIVSTASFSSDEMLAVRQMRYGYAWQGVVPVSLPNTTESWQLNTTTGIWYVLHIVTNVTAS
jgi:hypothetical protein